MSNSLLSLIVPAHNADKHITNTIESILSQTTLNWELVIIDDGSNDNTPTICDDFANKDSRIKVIHQKNGGVSSARNAGIDFASGQYLTFIDADDYLHPKYLEVLLSSIAKADLCVFKISNVENVNAIPNVFTPIKVHSKIYDLSEAYIKMSEMGLLHPPFCKLFRKSIIEKYSLRFDDRTAMGEDLLFNLAYLDHCKTIAIGQNHIYYYITGNSVLSKTIRSDYGDLQIRFYEERENFCKKHNINYTLRTKLYSILCDSFFTIAKASNLTKDVKASAIKRMRNSILVKKYLHENTANSISERLFRLILKYPYLEFLL